MTVNKFIPKYEMTDETRKFHNRVLHRIKALRDFGEIKAGDLGGWIEVERNLSQIGTCWVADEAIVMDEAFVCDSSQIRDCALIFGYAKIRINCIITDHSIVKDSVIINGDNATIKDTIIDGNAKLEGNAMITSPQDYFVLGPIGSRNDRTTFYKNTDGGISVSCGCFNGTISEFEKAVEETHGKHPYYLKQYKSAIELAKISILSVNNIE